MLEYGRLIGEHLSRHIPGNPTIIMEHMPGAGGVIAGNHIYGPGVQDGTKILLSHSIPLAEKLEPKGVRFESAKFQWLGTYDAIAHTMAIWHGAQMADIGETEEGLRGGASRGRGACHGYAAFEWPPMPLGAAHWTMPFGTVSVMLRRFARLSAPDRFAQPSCSCIQLGKPAGKSNSGMGSRSPSAQVAP